MYDEYLLEAVEARMRHKSIQKDSLPQHIHPTADQAMEPYLRQMRKVARRGADFDATSLGLLLLFLADDVTRSVATRLQPYGISEKKLDVLLLFTANEASAEPREPPTPTSIADYMNVTQS